MMIALGARPLRLAPRLRLAPARRGIDWNYGLYEDMRPVVGGFV